MVGDGEDETDVEEYQGDGNDIVNGNGNGTAANARQESAIARIVLLQGHGADGEGKREYEVFAGNTTVGRAEECDIVLDHPTVSRVHCRLGIVREDDEELFCTIVDGQSNVGTFLQRGDGAPSAIYLTPRKLCHENVIVIGKFRLVFLITGLPRSKIATEAPARPLTGLRFQAVKNQKTSCLERKAVLRSSLTTPAVPIEGDPLEQTMEKVAAQDDQDLKQVEGRRRRRGGRGRGNSNAG